MCDSSGVSLFPGRLFSMGKNLEPYRLFYIHKLFKSFCIKQKAFGLLHINTKPYRTYPYPDH